MSIGGCRVSILDVQTLLQFGRVKACLAEYDWGAACIFCLLRLSFEA